MAEAAIPAATNAPSTSVHDRLKAVLSRSFEAPPDEGSENQTDDSETSSGGVAPPVKRPVPKAVPNEKVEGDDAPTESEDQPKEPADDDQSDDAQTEDAQPSTLKELAEALGWDEDKILDLAASTKIDGKEGTARLRDLLKSYQLDGHINQKLATLDTDRKTFESKKVEHERTAADRLLKLDAGMQTLERALAGEYAAVDWQKLSTEDPVRFNSEWVGYNQRYAILQDIGKQIAGEKQAYQQQMEDQSKAYRKEQFELLQAKVPEWSDTARRNKDKAEIVEVLKDFGITQQEFESIVDHRQLLVVRDAVAWRKLQKAKPGTLNKVKAAPKLLKPGTMQSRAAKDALADDKDRAKLKQTGKVGDAVPSIRRRLFGGR